MARDLDRAVVRAHAQRYDAQVMVERYEQVLKRLCRPARDPGREPSAVWSAWVCGRSVIGADEHEVLRTRTHAKALFWPALGLVLIGAAVGAGCALIPSESRPVGQLGVALVGLVLAIWWAVIPFLRWRTTTYTVTNRRLLTRSGILSRTGQQVPLDRVVEVNLDRSLADRMLGCGTLTVVTAGEDGALVLDDIPEVEAVHAELSELLYTDPLDRRGAEPMGYRR